MASPEALDSMALAIAGVKWDALQYPEHRIQIMTLVLADERNAILDAIEGHMSNLLTQAVKINEQMDYLTDHTGPIMEWFDKSKLWEGEAYVKT